MAAARTRHVERDVLLAEAIAGAARIVAAVSGVDRYHDIAALAHRLGFALLRLAFRRREALANVEHDAMGFAAGVGSEWERGVIRRPVELDAHQHGVGHRLDADLVDQAVVHRHLERVGLGARNLEHDAVGVLVGARFEARGGAQLENDARVIGGAPLPEMTNPQRRREHATGPQDDPERDPGENGQESAPRYRSRIHDSR